jgi:PAS domain S-box-containing protein
MIRKDFENGIIEFESILNLSSVITYTCEAFGEFDAKYVSKNISNIMGYTSKEFLTKGFWASHIHPDDASTVFENIERLFENNYHEHQYRFRFKNGSIH